MKNLKKLNLTSNKELGAAFDSLQLTNADMKHFVGGCFCSTNGFWCMAGTKNAKG